MNYLRNIWPQYIPGKYGTFDAHQVTKLTSLSHIYNISKQFQSTNSSYFKKAYNRSILMCYILYSRRYMYVTEHQLLHSKDCGCQSDYNNYVLLFRLFYKLN